MLQLANVLVVLRRFALGAVALALLSAFGSTTAMAGGPRWVSGPPYFNNWYAMISWYTSNPQYFTDPGDLSPTVSHAAADAMVAQAASVWNIQTASVVLSQGGSLNEHVSGADVSAGSTGLVLPADVQSTNYAAKQIAVIYDTDGSVTDLLLGSGASDPSGCLQTGVTESVDSITPGAQIQHALLILNGRCTGSAPEKQLQMQYQLMRAFGRILGLGWSQTNDNVFTGSPTPSKTQALNWPIMHPIDILCGLYSYQCLPQPFTLRPDDISGLEQLYFIGNGQAATGKSPSWTAAGGAYGWVTFPNGQGMEGVNVVVHRRAPFWNTAEDWESVSAVTGYLFRGQGSTSMVASGSSAAASMGVVDGNREGYWRIQSVPIPPSEAWTDMIISTQAINPLYTGPYAIGATTGDTISPSGSSQFQVSPYLANGRDNLANFTPADAAPTCNAQGDGTEGAPAAVSQGGWWTGTFCGYQHEAWSSFPVKANRSFTIEVTALDENGLISMTKAMPIIGVWKSTDATGTLPTVAVTTDAFNTLSVGLTSLQVPSAAATTFRIALADQRGAGRPDLAYQARTLYADSIAPATLSSAGGSITITGMGFRQGNTVLVNGVPATVTSWTPTSIVATAPSLHTLGLSRALLASVTVQDPSTGGSSVMSAALTYTAPVEALTLVAAPGPAVTAGTISQASFSVRAIAPDGFTGIVGEAVSFTATGAGAATLSPCAAAACTVMTDANGVAQTGILPTVAGIVTLTATGRSGTVTTSFTASVVASTLRLVSVPSGTLTTGQVAATALQAQLVSADGTTARSGYGVTLSVVSGKVRFGACSSLPCTLTTDTNGMASTTVTPLSSGTVSVQFAAASTSVTASIAAASETMQRVSGPSGTQNVGSATTSVFAVKVLAGDGVTAVSGESVVFSATGAAVQFGACGGSVCTLTTDAQGLAQSSVVATAPGAITLTASGNAGSAVSAFTAVAPPDLLQTVSAPAGSVIAGSSAAAAFAVRITAADGTTPVVGKTVTFSASTGAVIFSACGSASCVVLTDATGLASTPVSPTVAGPISLVAISEAGSATATFTAAAHIRSVTPKRSTLYIAEGAILTWTPQVTLADNAAGVSGVAVTWSGAAGLLFYAPTSLADGNGLVSSNATAGPLAGGALAQATVCAWVSVCVPVTVQAVAASDWRLLVVSGAGQAVASGSNLAPVVFRVVDANGDPVAGAPVQINQVVNEWETACNGSGRCAQAATLLEAHAVVVSDINGLFSVIPAQAGSTAGVTQIAAITGTAGFATVSAQIHP